MTHKCHWPKCPKEVPPKLWGCSTHWFMLPPQLRYMINKAYVKEQEVTMTPSAQYIEAAKLVQEWIKNYERNKQASGKAESKEQPRNESQRNKANDANETSSSA